MDNNKSKRPSKMRSSDGNNRHEKSNFRMFLYIMIGFAATTSTINMMYHRNSTMQTEPELDIDQLLHVFKNGRGKRVKNGEKKFARTSGEENKLPPYLKQPTKLSKNDQSRGKKKKIEKSARTHQLAVESLRLKTDATNRHALAGLSCAKYGGPSDEVADEMVYWSDIPSDSSYASPFKKKASRLRGGKPITQYMTFEPDEGGWNNIRMAMETVVVMAHSMGRTLVLPPAQGIYLLRKDRDKHKIHFSFADFFHLESLHLEHAGIDIITTEEFLLREAMTGNLRDKTSGEVVFPPNNRTNWDGYDQGVRQLKEWMREVTQTPVWNPSNCMAAFPASTGQEDIDNLNKEFGSILEEARNGKIVTEMTEVDANVKSRMNEMRAGRKKLCVYDSEMQNTQVLHFMCAYKLNARLLVHFYAFFFFENWKQQLWVNRFVRDHLRYIDELQCTAARVVAAIRKKAKENGNPEGIFDTFHVRRGDFQYKDTRIEAKDLYKYSADLIPANTTLYIATDERAKEFFRPIEKHYHVYYLDDFKHLYANLNTNYYGMLDQLIASRGRTFVGTFYSTFTGYINRMRGYHSQKQKLEGYERGVINSFYFFPKHKKGAYQRYEKVAQPFWAREFPASWRDINKGIGNIR